MGYPVDFEKGELNRGNWKRIKECMKKPVLHTGDLLCLSGL